MKKNQEVFYTCPYCGEEYADPIDLAHCILSCEELKKKKEEKERQERLAEEKENRYNEVLDQQKKLSELVKSYIKDYGTISLKKNSDDFPTNFFWNHMFL